MTFQMTHSYCPLNGQELMIVNIATAAALSINVLVSNISYVQVTVITGHETLLAFSLSLQYMHKRLYVTIELALYDSCCLGYFMIYSKLLTILFLFLNNQ